MATPQIPSKLQLDVVTPQGMILSTAVDEVTATGALGEFGILPGHLPLLSALRPGPFRFKRQGEVFEVQLGAGFVEAGPDHMVVLADTFERGEIFALRSLLEWQGSFETEALRNVLVRAEGRLRELEASGGTKGEEYPLLSKLTATARERLEKR